MSSWNLTGCASLLVRLHDNLPGDSTQCSSSSQCSDHAALGQWQYWIALTQQSIGNLVAIANGDFGRSTEQRPMQLFNNYVDGQIMKVTSLRFLVFGLSAAVWVAIAPSAISATLTYSALLENDFAFSTASGTALVTYDTDTKLMTVNATFTGLTGTTTVAHIHCCTDPPSTVGVAVTPGTLPDFPVGVTSGNYTKIIDLDDPNNFVANFINNFGGGTVDGAIAALVAGMDSGRAYFNIHTATFPGGEIRGFLSPVPVPAALPLLVSGLAALGVIGWHRKRKEKLATA